MLLLNNVPEFVKESDGRECMLMYFKGCQDADIPNDSSAVMHRAIDSQLILCLSALCYGSTKGKCVDLVSSYGYCDDIFWCNLAEYEAAVIIDIEHLVLYMLCDKDFDYFTVLKESLKREVQQILIQMFSDFGILNTTDIKDEGLLTLVYYRLLAEVSASRWSVKVSPIERRKTNTSFTSEIQYFNISLSGKIYSSTTVCSVEIAKRDVAMPVSKSDIVAVTEYMCVNGLTSVHQAITEYARLSALCGLEDSLYKVRKLIDEDLS